MIRNLVKLDSVTLPILFGNLAVLIGVVFLGWNGVNVFVAYVTETLIIGVLHILKMFLVIYHNPADAVISSDSSQNKNGIRGYWLIPFFVFHYGLFCFVQSALFFSFAATRSSGLFNVAGELKQYFSYADTQMAFLTILASNIFYMFNDFILNKKYKSMSASSLFMQPYIRVFVQQFVVIFGGFIMMLSGSITFFAVFFLLLRTFLDLVGASLKRSSNFKEMLVKNLTKNKSEEDELKKTFNNIFGKDENDT